MRATYGLRSWIGLGGVGAVLLAYGWGTPAPPATAPSAWDWSSVHSELTLRRSPAALNNALLDRNVLPLAFSRDVHPSSASFQARAQGYDLQVTAREAVLRVDTPLVETAGKRGTAVPRSAKVHWRLVGASPAATLSPSTRVSASASSSVRYTQLTTAQAWPGIDLVYGSAQPRFAAQFVVAAQADPSAIQIDLTGASTVSLDRQGNLVLGTASGTLVQLVPAAHQILAGTAKTIPVHYTVQGHRVAFRLGAYDHSQVLTIATGPLSAASSGAKGIAKNTSTIQSSSASSLGFPDPGGCASTPPAINTGTQPGFPGLWWNPSRYGTGWEFNFLPQGVYLTWLTYDALHRPVWLSSGGTVTVSQIDPATGAQEYSVPLYRPTWVPGNATYQVGAPVGQVAVAFKPGTQVAAAVRWQWDDAGSAAQVDECVYDYFHAPSGGSSGLQPLNESYTGAWYSPGLGSSGWGLFADVGTRNGATAEVETAAIYDTAGNTVWVQGVNPGQPLTDTQSLSFDYPKSSASGYPNGFPTNTCLNSSCTNVTQNIGTLTRSFATSQSGTVTTLTAVVDATTTGSDAVNWPNAPVNYPSNLVKLSDTTVILVNQNPCVIATGQSTCPLVVSWSTPDTTAQVFQRDLTTTQLSAAPISTASSGSVTINLTPGADVQFEMYSGTAGGVAPTGYAVFVSAEVVVVGGTTGATAPNAPTSVTAAPPAAGSGAVPVSWVPDAASAGTTTSYTLAQSTSPGGPWTVLNNSLPASPTSTTATVSANGTYYFAVAACNASGCSAYTASGAVTVSGLSSGTSAPNPPTSVTAIAPASGSGAVPVSWVPDAATANATTYYRLAQSTSSGGPWIVLNNSLPTSPTSTTATVSANSTYYFAIAACNASGCSAYTASGAITVGGLPATTAPNAPTSVTATGPAPGAGSVPVSWAPDAATASTTTYYTLAQSTSSGGPWTVLNASLPTSPTNTMATVTANGTYYFGIAACDTVGCSGYTASNAVIVSLPPPAPNPPTSVSASASGAGAASVSWVPNAASASTTTSYQLSQASSLNGPWTVLQSTLPTSPTSATATVTSSGMYYFGIAACNAAGCSPVTASTPVAIFLPTPVVPLAMPPAATAVNDLPAHDPTVGTLAGQAGTDGGAAQYRVPIVVPPGRAGMQPDLALTYNSRSGNGLLGLGWTIAGLSSIHRCPQTPEQDGQTLGVNYTNTDRLCLDGQRLVAVSGTYGMAGTEYRTEVDSYARITQVGGSLTGTATCFRVEQKDGRVLHYGAVTGTIANGALSAPACAASTVNSRVQPGGAPSTLSWLVEKIEDRVGNNQLYQYVNAGNGEVLLKTVSYTGFGTAAGDRTVSFAYQARTAAAAGSADISSSYLAGGLTMQTHALASITTAVGGGPVRTTTPGYTASQYNQRLMLTSLTQCAGAICYPATQFSYNDSAPTFVANPMTNINSAMPAGLTAHDARPIGDLDGDGAREVAIPALSSSNGGLRLFLTQITADNTPHGLIDLTGTRFTYATDGTADFVDLDGDGRAELLLRPPLPPGATVEVQGTLSIAQWKGPRGVRAESLVTPGVTPQQNFDALFTTIPTNITLWSGDKIYAADMNGDGRPDLIVLSPNAGCPVKGNAILSVGVQVYLNAMTGPLVPGQTATFTAPSGPLLCLDQTNTQPSTGVTGTTQLTIDHIADFDGDGIPDLFIGYALSTFSGVGNSTQLDSVKLIKPQANGGFQVISKNCGATGLNLCKFSQTANSTAHHWMDVNGDGLEDFVYAVPGGHWMVQLNQGGAYGTPIDTGSSAGLDTGFGASFRYAGKTPMLDVDGDGKPDLLTPSTLNPNPFVVRMCTLQMTGYLPNDPGGCPEGFTASIPIGGKAVKVSTLNCPVYACPEIPGTSNVNLPLNAATDRAGFKYTWRDEPAAGLYTSKNFQGGPEDFSSYHMDMLKFVQTGPAAFTVVQTQTAIVSQLPNTTPVNAAVTGSLYYWTSDVSSVSALNFVAAGAPASKDIGGRGLDNLTTLLGCPVGQTFVQASQGTGGYYMNSCEVVGDGTYGPAILADGTPTSAFEPVYGNIFNMTSVLYSNDNQGAAGMGASAQSVANGLLPTGTTATTNCPGGLVLPGLMNAATNGLGDTAQWGYDTLAVGMLCTRDGVPEYTIRNPDGTTSGYVDARHYYFASSMPVVGVMLQSNGIGGVTGARSAVYSYSEAMYHHLGRGFQGFHGISVENATSDASRRLITTTTFNQKFPLAGRVAQSVTRTAPSSGLAAHPVHTETASYACLQAGGAAAACPQSDSTTMPLTIPTALMVQRPLATAQASADFDLASGAPSAHASTTNTAFDAYANLLAQTGTHVDDVAGGQFVASHTVATTNAYYAPDIPNWNISLPKETTATSSIAYAGGHALPAGASAPAQTVDTQFTWNADRSPATKTAQAQAVSGDANQESTTAYTYPAPSTGLPSTVTISAPSLTAPHKTNLTYTKDGTTAATDGYFVLTTTNALNQTTTVNTQPSDGQPTHVVDANGIVTATTYDAFGRATQVTHRTASGSDIESPVNTALTRCAGSCGNLVGEDGNQSFAVTRATTTQAGYPTKAAWFDGLGRTVKAAQAQFSGTSASVLQYAFSATLTDYDENAKVAMQSTPYFVGSGLPYFMAFTYDALGRTTQKLVPATCGGTMTTSYAYSGRTTTIIAGGTCTDGGPGNGPITMSRSNNGLGQLMRTVDANGKTTNYWTDAQGHVAAIVDVEGNITRATYNALGQRLSNHDPDQGDWAFAYDALGKLVSQTDARGVTATTTRDVLGRILTKQSTTPSSGTGGVLNETVLDTTSYDPVGAIGQIGSVTRTRSTAGATPTWQEKYTYDTGARPIRVDTAINEDAAIALTSQTSFDTQGRLDTQTYPSGLQVKHRYTAYGELDALSNAQSGTVYWVAQAQNAWGHVTQEQYPGQIAGQHTESDATGQMQNLAYTGSVNDAFAYQYDSFGNVANQSRGGPFAYVETYTYDNLQRLTGAARNGAANSYSYSYAYAYSASGNLTSKSDNPGSYAYATVNTRSGGCGPHAANSAGGNSYQCDPNGNVIGGSTLTQIQYDADNFARTATRAGAGQTNWTHDANGQLAWSRSSQGSRYYGPGGYEQVGTGVSAKQIHELGPVILTRTGGNAATDQISIALRDRLGSMVDEVDSNVPTARTYDAFGKPLLGNGSSSVNGLTASATLSLPATIHGFTKHEHDDDTQLINMVGRLYDPALGRFLQSDIFIQNPADSQSINGYSYVGNNPLSGVDPTGFSTCKTSEQASTSECGQVGVHTIVGDDGSKTTLVVGDAHSNISIEGKNVDVKNLSPGKLNIAINWHNGAEDWVANGPKGGKPSPDGIGSIAASPNGCGSLDCYNVHYDPKSRLVESAERTFVAEGGYAAINGITNELGRAMGLMSIHVNARFGVSDFMLIHAPTGGMFHDIVQAGLDKNGFTTDIASHVAELLEENRKVSWVVHSGGGAIFAEAARVAVDGHYSLSNTTVAFDSGANNRMVTNSILSRGGAHLFKIGRFDGYFDRNNDAVPMIIGLRGGPIDMLRSIWSFPKLFTGNCQTSPHTCPVRNDE
jgi:RHS repeat-associated protein